MSANPSPSQLKTLTLSALGVVFGDIGTSPLYAIKEIFHMGLTADQGHVYGALSLVFWTLTLIVTTKYAIFIMRADNKGEGGIMALLALALQTAKNDSKKTVLIVTAGLIGAVLFYGDSIITPAISVLSAIEGLEIIAPKLDHYVVPATLIILIVLFAVQYKGTEKVGTLFAPIMCVWFATLALLGIVNIAEHPQVIAAVNPYYAVALLVELGWKGVIVISSVVLVVTGAEALYADMGHFGLKPIRFAWFGLVFPALLLNYFGQGALIITHPEAIENPFYLMAPHWALTPLLILSTLATVIASQAVISGAFSMSRQAIQLGYVPRMSIRHTSDDEMGQIYIPTINWMLMVAVFILVLSFKSSTALASAYGLAVTGTMITTTMLAFIVIKEMWHWDKKACNSFLLVFLTLDVLYFLSNTIKIPDGGWLPLLVGALLFLIIQTWLKGRKLLAFHWDEHRIMFEELESKLPIDKFCKAPGTAIYLAKNLHGVPQVLLQNLRHNRVLHDKIIVLTIVTKDVPFVNEDHRIKVRVFGDARNFYRVKLYFGFQEEQDVRRALQLCSREGLVIDPKDVSFFVGTERIFYRRRTPIANWQRVLFKFLFQNASSAIEHFRIPVDQVIEIGIRIEL